MSVQAKAKNTNNWTAVSGILDGFDAVNVY